MLPVAVAAVDLGEHRLGVWLGDRALGRVVPGEVEQRAVPRVGRAGQLLPDDAGPGGSRTTARCGRRPAGSTALWCHCSSRWVLVKLPSFSVCAAAGRKKTSVPMSSVRSSPVSISGPSFQNVAVSIIEKSRTTSQSRLAMPSRCILPLAEPTAGFSPTTK